MRPADRHSRRVPRLLRHHDGQKRCRVSHATKSLPTRPNCVRLVRPGGVWYAVRQSTGGEHLRLRGYADRDDTRYLRVDGVFRHSRHAVFEFDRVESTGDDRLFHLVDTGGDGGNFEPAEPSRSWYCITRTAFCLIDWLITRLLFSVLCFVLKLMDFFRHLLLFFVLSHPFCKISEICYYWWL